MYYDDVFKEEDDVDEPYDDVEEEDGYGFIGLPATKMAYDYAALAVNAMINGELDYVIVDNAPANAIAKSINNK